MPLGLGRFPPHHQNSSFPHNHSAQTSHIQLPHPPVPNSSLGPIYSSAAAPIFTHPANSAGPGSGAHSGIPRNYSHPAGVAGHSQSAQHVHPSSLQAAHGSLLLHNPQQPHSTTAPQHHMAALHSASIPQVQSIQNHPQQFHPLSAAQSHQLQHPSALDSSIVQTSRSMNGRSREVWKDNLLQEMHLLRYLVDRYPYISMDTEFPGVVARPMGDFFSKAGYHYQTLRCNVDLLKLIQLGITLFSPTGELPPHQLEESGLPEGSALTVCPCTWTFNFKFSTESDMFSQDSIDLLRKAGADFDKHYEMGIDPADFGSLLITSGLVLSDDVHWISFHSGYDFAYLIKMMWCKQLPNNEVDYRKLADIFFPRLLDVKFLLRHIQRQVSRTMITNQDIVRTITNLGSKSALQDLADELGCQRVGAQHTAGSDAWLTGLVFWKMKSKMFDNSIPPELNGQIWGISNVGPPATGASASNLFLANQISNYGAGNGLKNSQLPESDAPTTPTSSSMPIGHSTPGVNPHGMSNVHGTPSAFGNFQYAK